MLKRSGALGRHEAGPSIKHHARHRGGPPETATCGAASISQMPISCSTTARPDGQQQRRAAGLYAVVLLVGNVIISAVKPKVHRIVHSHRL
jgi:hypothetical protein